MDESGHDGGLAAPRSEAASKLRVLLTTEATYPYYWGGLSTWCHSLVTELSDVAFSLIAVCDDPLVQPQFELPPNLVEFRKMPLWGVRNAWELESHGSCVEYWRRRRRTTEEAVAGSFLPAFRCIVEQLLGAPRDDAALARALHSMYWFFRAYDFDATFRSHGVWQTFCVECEMRFPDLARRSGYAERPLTVGELSSGLRWVYHWLFPLSRPLPHTDVAHATMAGICSLVAVVAKLDQHAGFLLSEHGIYLREAYLAEYKSAGSLFGKMLKLAFARRMTELAYAYADAVAPCCDYNQRWERRIGAVERRRIHTAYYGLDSERYRALPHQPSDSPVVVWAGRIDPLKDVETLLRAAAVVRDARPDVRFLLLGSAPPGNDEYLDGCLQLRSELGLEQTVTFAGFSPDVAGAFARADLVVLSSISEGFPYTTLEAMLCGKPIVATAVGGIAEQVTPDCGRIVRPRDPRALGEAILDVLSEIKASDSLARAARDRVVSHFGIERFRGTHRAIYELVLDARGEAFDNDVERALEVSAA